MTRTISIPREQHPHSKHPFPPSAVSLEIPLGEKEFDEEMISLFIQSLKEKSRERSSHQIQGMIMRLIDITAAIILLVLLAPILLVVAAVICLESRGPVFFLQDRRGLMFNSFKIWKFRSMSHGVPDPSSRYETKSTDARITRVGHFIRRTSIDELPQLFNVLAGTMSLVGPRPLVEWESIEAAKAHGDRYLVRPGITGLSQIEVRNGASFERRLDKDIEYVSRKSLWLDVLILARTPWQVLQSKMIYPDRD